MTDDRDANQAIRRTAPAPAGDMVGSPKGHSQATPIEPTPEMLAFYERRTSEHIERVRRCLTLLARVTDYGEELIERAKVHDASKFGPEEQIPYVWLTEYHRCRR